MDEFALTFIAAAALLIAFGAGQYASLQHFYYTHIFIYRVWENARGKCGTIKSLKIKRPI